MFKKSIKYLFSFFGFEINKTTKVANIRDKFSRDNQINSFEWLKDFKIVTIIDVGANEGQFAKKIIGVFPDAQVHCFEPLLEVFSQLNLNFYGNENILTYNFGLGEINEEKIINYNEYSPSSSMLDMLDLHKSNFEFAVKTEPSIITIRRLDDIFVEPVKSPLLLKIDVQGYEMNVLKGGEKIIRRADVVIIETTFVPLYKGQPLFAEIYNYFVSFGFQYSGNIDQLLSPKNHQVLQADAVFINRGSELINLES
jgi:FkbM family methyltransferase